MPTLTISVPEELHREIRRHREVRWEEIAKLAVVRELRHMKIYDRLLGNLGSPDLENPRRGASRRRTTRTGPRSDT